MNDQGFDKAFDDITASAPPVVATASRLSYDGPKAPLFKALAEARKHFASLSASATADVVMKSGGKYQFSYAPLDVVLEALQPGLVASGLAILQPFDGDVMYTIVAFEGSSVTVETPLPSWSTPQELGSLLTYIRRYQLKGIFGVADSEDDDGNTASGNKAQVTRKEPTVSTKNKSGISKERSDEVTATAKEKGLTSEQFLKLVYEQTGNKWRDCDDLDAAKVLAAMVLLP